jgi:hypothetical protein
MKRKVKRETLKIVFTSDQDKKSFIVIEKPEGFWVNAEYGRRAELSSGNKVTLSQFLNTNNGTIIGAIEKMNDKQRAKFFLELGCLFAKKAEMWREWMVKRYPQIMPSRD